MAIYQYQIIVIPRQSVLRYGNIIPAKAQVRDNPVFDEDELINVKWWNKENIDFSTIEKKIREFVNEVDWAKGSETVKTFGDSDTNDITIVKDEFEQLEEMNFRVDLRQIDNIFIDNVLAIAKGLDCLLLDRQGNLFDPTSKDLSENIQKSNAFKFVTNPTDFLDKLGKEIKIE